MNPSDREPYRGRATRADVEGPASGARAERNPRSDGREAVDAKVASSRDEIDPHGASEPRAEASSCGDPPESAPGDTDEPTFAEPWQAQAFALATSLHANGLFDWPEWSATLADALAEQDPAAAGDDYYRCWLAALERLLGERGVVTADELERTAAAWQRAAHATPHGQPILLENDPESGPAR